MRWTRWNFDKNVCSLRLKIVETDGRIARIVWNWQKVQEAIQAYGHVRRQ